MLASATMYRPSIGFIRKPTEAAVDIHTPVSIDQMSSVMPSSSRPWWALRRPSVALAIGASMPWSFSLARRHVQQALGGERAEHGAFGGVRARGHEDDADRVPGARGEDVVAHVADHVQALRVLARRRGALVLEQALPAFAAHQRREAVEDDRPDQRGDPGGRVR